MPHYYRVTDDVTNDPLYDMIDNSPSLPALLAKDFGSCLTGQINLAGAVFVQNQDFHCTNPPTDIPTIILQIP